MLHVRNTARKTGVSAQTVSIGTTRSATGRSSPFQALLTSLSTARQPRYVAVCNWRVMYQSGDTPGYIQRYNVETWLHSTVTSSTTRRHAAALSIPGGRTSDFNRLAVFLSESGLQITLASLTAPVMRRYIVWLRQGHAPWTIRRRIGSLRAFLGYCVDEELLDRNPMARVPTPKAPAPSPATSRSRR